MSTDDKIKELENDKQVLVRLNLDYFEFSQSLLSVIRKACNPEYLEEVSDILYAFTEKMKYKYGFFWG